MDTFVGKKIKSLFPDLEINQKVGEGVQGEVFLAKREGKKIILKVQANDIEDKKSGESTYYIYKKLMNVKSNYVHQVYNVEMVESKKKHYVIILMEYIEGDTLMELDSIFNRFKKDYTMEQIKLMLVFSLLSGLQSMFQENVFHRDIKPQNIMVKQDVPECVFIDYGIGCDYDNFDLSRCQEGSGNWITKPFHIKSFVDKRYFYSQSLYSARLACKKDKYDKKDPEVLQMFKDVDLWGVIFLSIVIELYEPGKTFNDIFFEDMGKLKIKISSEKLETCKFSTNLQNSVIGNNSIRNFCKDKNHLLYKMFKSYINDNSVEELVNIMEKLLVENGLEVVPVDEEEKDEICEEWKLNPFVNPETRRKISSSGPKFRDLEKRCGKLSQQKEKEICDKWIKRKWINPETGRKISKTGKVFKNLKQKCQ